MVQYQNLSAQAQRFLSDLTELSRMEAGSQTQDPTGVADGRFLQDTAAAENPHEFSPVTFWAVNSIWISILLGMIIFFWKCKGAQRLQEWTAHGDDSDRRYAMRRLRQQAAREEAKKVTPEKRAKSLKEAFRSKKVLMTVTEKDIRAKCGSDDGSDVECGGANDSMDFSTHKTIVIPTSQGERCVPDCCAVCLGSYNVGETIVWSSNKDCTHAFHEDCVTDWLIKMQDGNPCPCCRQCFIHIDEEDGQGRKVKWDSEHAMNLGALTF